MEHRFITRLSIGECEQRLSNLEAVPSVFEFFLPARRRRVYGWIRSQSFCLHAIARWPGFKGPRLFYGVLQPSSDGTLVTGRFRMHPFGRVFVIGWFTILSLLFVIFVGASVTDLTREFTPALFGAAVTGSLLLFGAALLGVVVLVVRPAEKDVLSFILERLEN
ncbi:MAG: hypothetical protein HKM89_09955 [Gemmatimonadales bacterium]|nr:hypothetical protein [Gemmatimonadales bacterium]